MDTVEEKSDGFSQVDANLLLGLPELVNSTEVL